MRTFAFTILFTFFLTGMSHACSNPMSNGQLDKVKREFKKMTPGGDGFKIDRCRNITIRYGSKAKSGKLHQLFTQLNGSHHDTTYFGLIEDGEWWVYGSGGGIYLYHPNKSKQQSAEWMIDLNARTVRLLKLAGYDRDPQASKRAEILQRDLDELGTPDFAQSASTLLNIIGRYSPSASQSNSSNQCSRIRQTCVAQCNSLPRGKGVYAGFGPSEKCKSQCEAMSC